MEEKLIDKIHRRLKPVSDLLERIGFVWLWLALSLLLLMPVVALNPAKFGAYLWFMSKMCGAFALGYGFDWAAFRGADPRYMQDGIEKTMAQSRRAMILGFALASAGLIG